MLLVTAAAIVDATATANTGEAALQPLQIERPALSIGWPRSSTLLPGCAHAAAPVALKQRSAGSGAHVESPCAARVAETRAWMKRAANLTRRQWGQVRLCEHRIATITRVTGEQSIVLMR